MMDVEEKSMFQLIKECLLLHPDLTPQTPILSQTPFYCYNYNDDPSYVSDGNICIQVVFPGFNKLWQTAKVNNRSRTPFYNTFKGSAKAFNCTTQMLQSIPDESDIQPNSFIIYHPMYHFKDRFKEFKVERSEIKIKEDKSMFYVKKWEIYIVNIGITPSYAPIIKVLEYQAIRRPFSHLLKISTSILYDPFIVQMMVRIKAKELRAKYKAKPIKLLFSPNRDYQNSIMSVQSMPGISFLNAHNNVLSAKRPSNKPPTPTSYLYMGSEPSMNKFYHFKKPIGNTYKNVVISSTDANNIKRYENFYDKLKLINPPKQNYLEDKPYYQLLDDEEESSKNEASEEDEDEDDPLRMLYKRMLLKEKGDKDKGREKGRDKEKEKEKDKEDRDVVMQTEIGGGFDREVERQMEMEIERQMEIEDRNNTE